MMSRLDESERLEATSRSTCEGNREGDRTRHVVTARWQENQEDSDEESERTVKEKSCKGKARTLPKEKTRLLEAVDKFLNSSSSKL